jgi:hypothetical protein
MQNSFHLTIHEVHITINNLNHFDLQSSRGEHQACTIFSYSFIKLSYHEPNEEPIDHIL